VDLLVAEATDMGFKAIINNKHWGLIHKNEIFKFMRAGKEEKGFIKEVRADGKISLSLQPVGQEAATSLNSKILAKLRERQERSGVDQQSVWCQQGQLQEGHWRVVQEWPDCHSCRSH
jgi:predicted RNA-binding protein (virulence factor B family)